MLKAQILAFTQPSVQDVNSRQKQREAANTIFLYEHVLKALDVNQ